MEFYAARRQPIIGSIVLLPQEGSVTGGSKRPLNSWAILRDGHSILFDAPVSWVMEDVARLADEGHRPAALVLSHRDLAGSGDAFQTFHETYDAPILLHASDQAEHAPLRLTVPLGDPMQGKGAKILKDAGIEVIHIPGHSQGSIMLYLADAGGILLAGDSAVGPGPEQSEQTPRLQRPIGADEDARFLAVWRHIIETLPISAVLPLHGLAYLRRDHSAEFESIVANIWSGPPMDPNSA